MKLFENFVKQMDEKGYQMEGLQVLKDGKEIFQYRWSYDKERNIYSHTKSFVSTAIGIAVGDGILSLDERLVDVFPEKIPQKENPGLEKVTLRHLLMMASGFDKPLLMLNGRKAEEGFPDYVAYMMEQPVRQEPGTKFMYSSGDSILAARILEERLGMNLMEYMYTRVFKPLEIPLPIWECCPKGHPIGGSGLFLKLTDMAKLGQLYLDEGKWKGQQVVPAEWVKQASAKQIENPTPEQFKNEAYIESPWHEQGYGYQFWRCCYPDSYRADGAFGQISLVLPQQGMVIAMQCPESGNFMKVQKLLHETIQQL